MIPLKHALMRSDQESQESIGADMSQPAAEQLPTSQRPAEATRQATTDERASDLESAAHIGQIAQLRYIRLRGVNGALEGQRWSFNKPVRVGRSNSADLILTCATNSISRKHAMLWPGSEGWWLKDLDSRNGTFWNGRRVENEQVGPLQQSDIIQFGTIALRIESVDSLASTASTFESGASALDFGTVQIGEPTCRRSLAIFPLFLSERHASVEYVLSDEAVQAGTVTVCEVSESGNVPELRVENRGAIRVLFLEGEELRGGKQNRIIN